MKLIDWLKDRWQDHVQPHISSERISTACDVIVVGALIHQWWPWF
ncbi:hypothetical protein ACGFY7_04520 [Streptomyces prunicolor]